MACQKLALQSHSRNPTPKKAWSRPQGRDVTRHDDMTCLLVNLVPPPSSPLLPRSPSSTPPPSPPPPYPPPLPPHPGGRRGSFDADPATATRRMPEALKKTKNTTGRPAQGTGKQSSRLKATSIQCLGASMWAALSLYLSASKSHLASALCTISIGSPVLIFHCLPLVHLSFLWSLWSHLE